MYFRKSVVAGIVGVLCAGWAVSGFGQVRITKRAGTKSSIDLSGMTASGRDGQDFKAVVQESLVRSGWFERGAAGSSEFRVVGEAQVKGGGLTAKCEVFNTGTRQRMLGRTYEGKAGQTRALAHVVADEIVEAVTGKKGISSTRIVMVGTQTGKKELYICGMDGGGLVQLTRDNNISVRPRWSPDGQQVVYTSYLRRFPDIYQINVRTGQRDCIANYPGMNVGGCISPDGQSMAMVLSKDGNPELYVRQLRSGKLTRLTKTGKAAEASPSWSPDGQQLVYVSDQSGSPQLYTIARNGGGSKRLSSRGGESVSPDWGPNGLIVFSTRIGKQYQVQIIDPASGEIQTIPLDYANYEDPSWAPDGRHIVCTRTERYRSKVYLLDTQGDRAIPLHNHEGDWYSPAWSRLGG